jgi:uncharacterized membrane protein
MALLKKKAEVLKKKTSIMTPSQQRIFNMDKDMLIKHYALIRLKKGKLSTDQRRILDNRVNIAVDRGTITVEELQQEVDYLQDLIEAEAKTKYDLTA